MDGYNTLSFLNNGLAVGSVTGAQVIAAASGDQGANGTRHVNITSDSLFNAVTFTSSQFAFDNVAFNPTLPVPEPASLALLCSGPGPAAPAAPPGLRITRGASRQGRRRWAPPAARPARHSEGRSGVPPAR